MSYELKVKNTSQRNQAAEVKREAGITLYLLLVFLIGLESVVVVGVCFATKVGIDAEAVREIALGDETETETKGRVTAGNGLPGMIGVCECEGMATSNAGINNRGEAFPRAGQVEQGIGKNVDATEFVGIETMFGCLLRVAGAGVTAIGCGEASGPTSREGVAECDATLRGYKV